MRQNHRTQSDSPSRKSSGRVMRPSSTIEGRENQMIALAMDLVEKRLREGTATSQETVHFLRLGSSKAQLEQKMLENQIELAKAKTENLRTMEHIEELYTNAMNAMKSYGGSYVPEEDEEDD